MAKAGVALPEDERELERCEARSRALANQGFTREAIGRIRARESARWDKIRARRWKGVSRAAAA